MKNLILVVLLSSICIAQQKINPDGYIGGISIHLTPRLNSFHTDYNNHLNQKYAESGYDNKFDFDVMLKIPMNTIFTISLIYSHRNVSNSYKTVIDPIYKENSIGQLTTYGATFSIYIKP